MRENKLREMLDAGKPTIATHVHATWPSITEIVGHTGMYDYVEFVAEYGPFDLYAFDDFCRAAELHNMSSMIKIDQDPRTFVAQRAIGSGFQSVLFADCRTVEEVQDCVDICRPDTPEDKGTYGVAMRRFAYMEYGTSEEYVEALRQIVVAFMIEKNAAIDNLEEILAVDGVDMIQWGPADYTMSSGKVGMIGTPEVKGVERKVIELSLQAGVAPRAEIESVDQAKYYLDLGVRHFCIGTDIRILHNWLKTNGDGLRKAIEGA